MYFRDRIIKLLDCEKRLRDGGRAVQSILLYATLLE